MTRTMFEPNDIGHIVEVRTEHYQFVNGVRSGDSARVRLGRLAEFSTHPFQGIVMNNEIPMEWVTYLFEHGEKHTVPLRHIVSITRFKEDA